MWSGKANITQEGAWCTFFRALIWIIGVSLVLQQEEEELHKGADCLPISTNWGSPLCKSRGPYFLGFLGFFQKLTRFFPSAVKYGLNANLHQLKLTSVQEKKNLPLSFLKVSSGFLRFSLVQMVSLKISTNWGSPLCKRRSTFLKMADVDAESDLR